MANTQLKLKCKHCGKTVTEMSVSLFGGKRLMRLSCGHAQYVDQVQSAVKEPERWDEFVSSDHKTLLPFQKIGIEFAEKSNVRCLIADEQGLGKTVEALGTLHFHKEELFPCLWVGKSGGKVQTSHEAYRWLGAGVLNQVIENKNQKPHLKLFKVIIVGYDMLRSLPWFEDEEVLKQFKCLVMDEVQMIKNPGSKRTVAIRKAADVIPHIISLSGTPIKNNAGEYFTILNILKPEKFPSRKNFVWEYCETYRKAGVYERVGGIRDIEAFKLATQDFIIRRTRKEVMPDLPEIWRTYRYDDLSKDVEQAYCDALDEFMDAVDENGGSVTGRMMAPGGNILGFMSKMRHLTGLSKVRPTIEQVEEFLLNTMNMDEDSPDRKICLFIHHQDVHHLLHNGISTVLKSAGFNPPLAITSDMSSQERFDAVEAFKRPENRVMIASTGAAQEQLNMQFCSDFIMVERQWNPANEEQAEGRFPRIGSVSSQINGKYMVAIGTIDEYFAELVEKKRGFMKSTLDGIKTAWDESSLMMELAEKLHAQGRKKWSLR